MQFDHYCKIVLANEMRNIKNYNYYLLRNEKTFSELTKEEYNKLFINDKYECFYHKVLATGFLLEIENEQLFEAINKLPEHKRDVIMLSYWLGMDDKDISQKLNIVRRTVNYLRKSSLKQLKKYLENN
jgi:RNA polymerase sigma factor (sigma-70 family)